MPEACTIRSHPRRPQGLAASRPVSPSSLAGHGGGGGAQTRRPRTDLHAHSTCRQPWISGSRQTTAYTRRAARPGSISPYSVGVKVNASPTINGKTP